MKKNIFSQKHEQKKKFRDKIIIRKKKSWLVKCKKTETWRRKENN